MVEADFSVALDHVDRVREADDPHSLVVRFGPDKPLPLDSEVFLTLRLPATAATIETKGRVAWTWDMKKGTTHLVPGMGIRLVDTEPRQRQQLEAYLSGLAENREAVSAVSS